MNTRQRVILYGDSLVLSGVHLSLEDCPDFEVLVLDALHATEYDLLALHPDVVIFDTSSVQPEFRYDLIQQRSELQLIGIDPDRNQALLWSGQHLRELSVQDLVEGIRKTRRRERGKRRKENEETESRGDAEKSSP